MQATHLCAAFAASFVTSILVCPAADAQDAPQRLAPVVVTATRLEQALADALPDASVITRADIERSLAPDLLTVLRQQPGIEIAQLGGLGGQMGLFLRGAESRQVLVLIDGMPLNNLNFSTAALDQIMAAQIERVEIVRGNVSSLYGSQATGGVINVTTRRDAGGIAASASFGSRSTYQLAGSVGGGIGGPWRYGVALSGAGTRGFNAIDQAKRPGTNPDRDGYHNESASGHVAYAWSAEHSLALTALRSRGRLRYDSEFGPDTQADESVQTIETIGAVLRNRIAPAWTSRLALNYLRDALDARVTAYPYFVNSTAEQIAWQNDVAVAPDWTATLGAEHLRQRIDSDTPYATDHRDVGTLRAGLVGKIGAHQWQANVRHDRYSDFGAATTGYLGYGLALAPEWKIIGSVSNAFNAPTFNDLFYPYGGNPDLKPERSRSAEAAVQYASGATAASLRGFRTLYRDLIGYDSAFNRANVGQASVRGVELSLDAALGGWLNGWRARLAATFQDAMDDTAGVRLNRRARQFGSLQVARDFGAFDVQANVRASGDRRDTDAGQERLLAGYAVVDIAARWRLQPGLALTLRGENLLDRRYENAYGYRATPRGFFGGIEMRL